MNLAFALCFAAVLSAADPLVGTWTLNREKSTAGRAPLSKFERDGEFIRNENGQINYNFKIDGQEYPVTAAQTIDIAIWRQITPRKFEHQAKKDGKLAYTVVTEVAADGNTRTYRHTRTLEDGKTSMYETTLDRVGGETDSANPLIGQWCMRQTMQWTQAGKEFHFNAGLTEWSAAADGKDYRVTGSNLMDTVSLRRLDAKSIETTAKKGGKVVFTNTTAVSDDGKSLTMTSPRGVTAYDRVK